MNKLEKNLNYIFKDKQLLVLALTHCSYSVEHNIKNNQRLEFLGDAVLETVISEYLYFNYPDDDEGKLTRLRASIVSEEPLACAARELEVNSYVMLGAGERATGGQEKPSVLSDTLESIFAAVYLDGGFFAAKEVILNALKNTISRASDSSNDCKTALQEYLFRNGNVNIEYKLVSQTGPSHNSVFFSQVYCNGKFLGEGFGSSKKRSEQAAAKQALEKIKDI